MDLAAAVKMVKTKRDIRPNNGFLSQLIKLEETLLYGLRYIFWIFALNDILSGIHGNLVSLNTDDGKQMLKLSKEEEMSKENRIHYLNYKRI